MTTGQPNPQQPTKKDPVDALSALASGQASPEEQPAVAHNFDPLAALNRLASGDEDGQAAQEISAQADAGGEQADSYSLAPTGNGQAAAPAGTSFAQAAQQRERLQSAALAHSYKKTMIPLLLLVGVVLAVIAIVCFYIYMNAKPAWKSSGDGFKVLLIGILSVPLTLVMFFGAWWFHRETK